MATIISIVSYPFLPSITGGQKNVGLFYKYFSKYHQLICITTKKNDLAFAEKYQVLNFLSNSRLRYINIFYFFRIRNIIKEKKATHVLLEHPYYGWLGVLLKKFCGVKLIIHSHNIEGIRWKTLGKWWWKILLKYERFAHRNADYNFFIQDADKKYAVEKFGLDLSKCIVVTYGIEWSSIPPKSEIEDCKKWVRGRFGIESSEKIFLFNGAFNYGPNINALKRVVEKIAPAISANQIKHRIIICGKNIPEEISRKAYPNIVFAGFVDNISPYFKAADVFLNPITEGGGIKTKLVEALGYNLNAVSAVEGAVGINPALCNGKLVICPNNDWNLFAEMVIKISNYTADILPEYFQHFYWGYSTKKAAEFVSNPL